MPVLLATLFILLTSATAAAGTICGTVRDAATGNPVARAGVFVRTPAGAYIGLHGATDAAGLFCIAQVPAGTWDLEIRRDDYAVSYRRGVVVTEDVTGIEVDFAAAFRLLPPSPNPARGPVRIRFSLPESSPVRLTVADARGRLVHGWESPSVAAGEREITWSFRDAAGRPVPAGRYFLRMDAGAVVLRRSFVHLP